MHRMAFPPAPRTTIIVRDWPARVYDQYVRYVASITAGIEHGRIPTPREWQLAESQWQFLASMAPADHPVQMALKKKKKKRKKPQSTRTAARKQMAKGNAAYKKRKKPLKPLTRAYMWVAYGDAADYLCSRYVNSIWSAAHDMPVPGDATAMNDSHINCQCSMEYIGMIDDKGNIVRPQDRYDPDPYTTRDDDPIAP